MDITGIRNKLKFENQKTQVEIKKLVPEEIDRIKANSPTDIYLCGGGKFAGWLLAHKKIDILKVKLNPLIISRGIKLFEGVEATYLLHLNECEPFDNGMHSAHFMFSSIPLNACFFCGVGGPETVIEVFSKSKIDFTFS